MSNWADVTFRVPRHKDRELIELLLLATNDVELKPESLDIFPAGYNHPVQIPANGFEVAAGAKEIFESDSFLLSHVKIVAWPRTFVDVRRMPNEAFDTVNLHLGSLNNPGNQLDDILNSANRTLLGSRT